MFQRSIFKIFISTHSVIKHIQCIKDNTLYILKHIQKSLKP
jgi:hypothetical protein